MTGAIQVITTTASEEDALAIARAVVERRLAACAQVSGPITSTYYWQGRLETSREWVCSIKTRESCYPALEAAIRELHKYDLPEILALPVVAGSADYLAWLAQEVPGPPGSQVV